MEDGTQISASRKFPPVCYETYQKTFLLILIYFKTRPTTLLLGKVKLGWKVRPLDPLATNFIIFYKKNNAQIIQNMEATIWKV